MSRDVAARGLAHRLPGRHDQPHVSPRDIAAKEQPMNTRLIAIIALVLVVIVLFVIFTR